nr:unnamed protein product [Digitaria exilis]
MRSAALARAALAAGSRLPPAVLVYAGQRHGCVSPLTEHASGQLTWPEAPCSADPRRALELSPRRRRGPPGKSAAVVIHQSAVQMSRPRMPFPPCPVPSRRPRAPAVLACAALTPRTVPTARDRAAAAARLPSCPWPSLRPCPSCPNLPLPSPLKLRAIPFLSCAENLAGVVFAPPRPPHVSSLLRAQPCPTDAHRAIPLLPPPPQPPASPPPPAHVHSSLHSSSGRTEGTISFLVSRWCSPTPSPSFSDPDVTGSRSPEQAEPPPPSLTPLSIFPHFPGPDSPPFGRRNHAGEPRDLVVSSTSFQGAELYELVPAAEEIAQESEVNVVHVDPSPEQEYRFEPEGKPRSIT